MPSGNGKRPKIVKAGLATATGLPLGVDSATAELVPAHTLKAGDRVAAKPGLAWRWCVLDAVVPIRIDGRIVRYQLLGTSDTGYAMRLIVEPDQTMAKL